MSKILEEGECSESSSSEEELAGCYLTPRLKSFGKKGKDFLVKTEQATDRSDEIPNNDEAFGHQEKQRKKKPQEHRQREVSREKQSTLIKRIADVLVTMKELYNLLKKQDQFERQVLEVETDWYFKNINSEFDNVTQADKIDWILLNGNLEEVRSKRTRVENELAVQNLEDMLKSSDNTAEHRKLKYMLDLVGSIEKRSTFMSRERKNLHSKVRKINSDKKNLFGQIVKKCNETDEQSSEHAQSFPNCGTKRVEPGPPSGSAENTLPLLKKIKTEKENPSVACLLKNLKIEKEESPIVETVAKSVAAKPAIECKVEPIEEPTPETKARPETGHKLGPYWTYVASVIQCLKSTYCIKEYLVKNGYFPSISGTCHTAEVLAQNEKIEKLTGHLKAIWRGEPSTSISRNDTDVVIEHYNLSSTTFQQRDAHKLLLFLLNALHNDLAKLMKNDGESVTNREMEWRKALDYRSSIISDTFYGQFRITTKCSTCATMHATYETFKTITLPLTRTKSCLLIRCLERFFTPMDISGWSCPKCCVERKAKRTIEIIKVPPTVIFHLDRFSGCMGFGEKNNVMVHYPLRELNLGPYVAFGLDSNNSPSRLNVYTFQLYAVTCYDETVVGGRYTACCDRRIHLRERIWRWHGKGKCNMVETKWIENHGSKVQSYLLFYETSVSHIPDSR